MAKNNQDANGNWEYIYTDAGYTKNPDYVPNLAPAGSNDSTSELESSDFASTSGLPDWASEWVQGAVEGTGGQAFGNYLSSIQNYTKNVEAANERKRGTSNTKFTRDLAAELDDLKGTAARALASKGATSSSVGAEYMADVASQTYSNVLGQHESANQGAATSNYQAKVTQAAGYNDIAQLLGDYIGQTETKVSYDYGDMDLSDDGYTPTEGQKPSGATWDSRGWYSPPDEWGDSESQEGSVKTYTYDGKTFKFDTANGKTYDIRDAETGEKLDEETLNSADFASYTKLPEWGEDFVKGITKQYGGDVWSGYQGSVNAIGSGHQWASKTADKLDTQYSKLSAPASALLGATSRGITGTGARSSALSSYESGLNQMRARGGANAKDSNKIWEQNIKIQNEKDKIEAYGGLSGLVGDYLGLSRYSYDPNYANYLSMSGA